MTKLYRSIQEKIKLYYLGEMSFECGSDDLDNDLKLFRNLETVRSFAVSWIELYTLKTSFQKRTFLVWFVNEPFSRPDNSNDIKFGNGIGGEFIGKIWFHNDCTWKVTKFQKEALWWNPIVIVGTLYSYEA